MKPLRILFAFLVLLCSQIHATAASKPNVLVIITDQQHAGMLSCAGNPHLKTPNLDNRARTGAIREMIIDLARDAGEMKNRASDPAYRERLETGRRLLKEWYASHELTLDAKYIVDQPEK